MDSITGNRTVRWVIGLLVVLNLVLLGTFWYTHLKPPVKKKTVVEPLKTVKPGREKRQEDREKRSQKLAGFLQKELDFTRDQVEKFMELRREHFRNADRMQFQMRELRKEMMDHLLDEEPDMVEVEDLATQLGQKLTEHETAVFKHFLRLMQICDDRQKVKYRTFMKEIMDQLKPPDHSGPPGGKGHAARGREPRREDTRRRHEGERRTESFDEHKSSEPSDRDEMHREPQNIQQGPGQDRMEHRINLLEHQLELTASQVEKIRSSFTAAFAELHKIPQDSRYRTHHERREAAEKVHQQLEQQIEAILDEKQKERYRQMPKERPHERN